MKKLRLFLVATALASAFVVTGAGPASANCEGDPNVCVLICSVGQSNKYTEGAFKFCHTW
jgi:hypothetical protein